jgi:hypothetical protein
MANGTTRFTQATNTAVNVIYLRVLSYVGTEKAQVNGFLNLRAGNSYASSAEEQSLALHYLSAQNDIFSALAFKHDKMHV